MKLEVGKRYVMRNGEITGITKPCVNHPEWVTDGVNSWLIDGGYWGVLGEPHPRDIVAEYIEPASEPLRWVENCKPDKPGIWACLWDDGDVTLEYHPEKGFVPAQLSGTYCYLGPIPEILPPKKKVVQRLWLLRGGSCGEGFQAYREEWFGEDETIQPAGDWIRTCKTREVEQ